MSFAHLVRRSLTFYWRTNLAVCLGVAAAVAVLGGALLVGDSVRGSLRDIATSRLGRADHALVSTGYFRETLASDVAARAETGSAPFIQAGAAVGHERSGRRAAGVTVYGVDDRFWAFHGLDPQAGVLASPALASELGAQQGDVLLARLQRPSDIPLESLFAQKEDVGRTSRFTLDGVLPRERLGEFALQPQQGVIRALFVPLRRLQRDLDVAGSVNAAVFGSLPDAGRLQAALRDAATLDDLGVRVGTAGTGPDEHVLVESATGMLSPSLEAAAAEAGTALGLTTIPVFSYLANTIRVGDREVPYSLVTGVPLPVLQGGGAAAPVDPAEAIVLNEWTARELNAAVGDTAQLEYYLWDPAAGLTTSSASFTVAAIVPIAGFAADPRLAPEYPGITGAESVADWDPPFPLDLSRVRPQDERYWDEYRGTPKGFIAYDRARELWSTRYGRLTSMRFIPAAEAIAAADAVRERLRRAITPADEGLLLVSVRELAIASSAGATNFGEYFVYFSFFLVVSAVLLAVLFFRLGVEGRLRQIGVLRAAGYTTAHVGRLLLAEAVVLALAGSLLGAAGAVGYAHAIVYALKTWWIGAVGTTLLEVHVRPASVLAGALGGMATAVACVLLSLRAVARRPPRDLLAAYSFEPAATTAPRRARRAGRLAAAAAGVGIVLIVLGALRPALQAGAFFGAGAALLTAALLFLSAWLRRPARSVIGGRGLTAVSRLGFRNAAFRPGRSVLSAALVAAAVFIIVSVEAFRRDGHADMDDVGSGTGGYVLLAESEVPLVHNPNDAAGREALGLTAPGTEGAIFTRFRLRPGEDASCLNLYRPRNPRIIAPESSFVESGPFVFAEAFEEAEGPERANPWMLLSRRFPDGAVPAIADATSLRYVLHAAVGETMTFDVGGSEPLVVRFVGALRDSVLQGEIIIGDAAFVRLFPGYDGFRFFLIDVQGTATPARADALAEALERDLQPFGFDAVSTAERLAAFHRVENTYLSTFQALGGLGLLLGTLGLATVMFRNVLERRRELALLRAVGYNGRDVSLMILAETLLLLASGLAAGAGCAIIAIAPAWAAHGGGSPGPGLLVLLAAVLAAGLLSGAAATRAALGGRLLLALRAE